MVPAWLTRADALVVAGLFVGAGAAELLWPFRSATPPAGSRWFANVLLGALTYAWLMIPSVAGALAALRFGDDGPDLLGRLGLPDPVHFVVGVLLLDLAGYAMHRLYHRVRWLWRIHAVHHADPYLDITTAIRHHPAEQLLALVVAAALGVVFGVRPNEMLIYGWLAWATQFPGHANIVLPRRLDTVLRRFVVTPSFHHLHHSSLRSETDSNYAAVFSAWDMLFRTARSRPREQEAAIVFGLEDISEIQARSVLHQLAHPLLRQGGLTSPPLKAEKAG